MAWPADAPPWLVGEAKREGWIDDSAIWHTQEQRFEHDLAVDLVEIYAAAGTGAHFGVMAIDRKPGGKQVVATEKHLPSDRRWPETLDRLYQQLISPEDRPPRSGVPIYDRPLRMALVPSQRD